MTVPKRTRNLVIVTTTVLYISSITYSLPTRRFHSDPGGGYQHRAIASSIANTTNSSILNTIKRLEQVSAVNPCVTPASNEATPALDPAGLAVPTAFEFLQVPWIAGGAVEALTSLFLPLVQQGLDAISTSSSASMTTSTSPTETAPPGAAAAESTSRVIQSGAVEGTVVATYYADWAASQLAPEAVDWSRFNWVDFAFAIPNEYFELVFTQSNSEDLLRRLVAGAHAQGRYVKLSVGGWTGSAHFSRATSTSAGRSKLCRSIVKVYEAFGLDGIDIDWEYPNQSGAGNEYSPDDTSNFLLFLKRLRKKLPPSARITAATQVWPFADRDGQPLGDVSEFARVLDWILLMNYDVWGSSPNPGPNAPLADGCGNSTQPKANAEAAIRSWLNAGFTARQLVLGVPAYGYVSRSEREQLASRDERAGSTPSIVLSRTTHGNTMEMSAVEVTGDDGGSDGGQIQFNQLVGQGALVRNGGGEGGGNGWRNYNGAGGFERRWDSCSSTPWLRSEARRQVVTYDDPESMRLKGEMGRRYGILGVNLFAAHGDDGWALVDGVRDGLGLSLPST